MSANSTQSFYWSPASEVLVRLSNTRGAALVVMSLLVFSSCAPQTSAEDKYRISLEKFGSEPWPDPDSAIEAGKELCISLENGEPARGSAAELIAVSYLCDEYMPVFEVVEEVPRQ